MAEEGGRRISSQGAYLGGQLPALPNCALDADPEESSFIPTCLAQGDAAHSAVPAGSSAGLRSGALDQFATLCGIRDSSDSGLDNRFHQLALPDPGTESNCSTG